MESIFEKVSHIVKSADFATKARSSYCLNLSRIL